MTSNESVTSKTIRLCNGVEMPAIGTTTYRGHSEEEVLSFVDNALGAGYRLFDTAPMFDNEVALRQAFATLLPKYDLDRSDIFVTSKIMSRTRGNYTNIKKILQRTLQNLGLDYLDLYLINYPCGNTRNRKATWTALQTLYDEGCISAIGVSNFRVPHLRQIATSYSAPMVNQVEWNPMRHDEELYSYCQRHDIILQAYSPFGAPLASRKKLFDNPVMKGLASKYDVTVAQVLLAWSLQKEIAVLPSSTNEQHIKENIRINFKLSMRDMDLIDAMAPDFGNFDNLV